MKLPSPARCSFLLAGLVAGVLVQAPGAHAAVTPPNVHTGSVYVPNEAIVRYALIPEGTGTPPNKVLTMSKLARRGSPTNASRRQL